MFSLLKALPRMGSTVDCSKRGVGAFCQCVECVPVGDGVVGSRLQRWRCSLCFRSDTSISRSSQAAPRSRALRRRKRPGPSKTQFSIRQTRRATIARSARRSISPRRHFCRMRRVCRFRSRPEQSSILAFSISFLYRRNVRRFNRALLPSPDSVVADLTPRRAYASATAHR